jgi:hypothetical protein
MVVVGAATLGLTGCDDGETVPVRVTECRKVCEQRDMCIRNTDLADCEQRCDQQDFRSDLYYRAKARCVTDGTLSCDEWAEELDERGEDLCSDPDSCNLAACIQAELARQKVSAEQEQTCRRMSNVLAICEDAVDADDLAASCEDRLLEVSAEYAARTEECVLDSSGCNQQGCLDDLADMYGTDLRVFPRL